MLSVKGFVSQEIKEAQTFPNTDVYFSEITTKEQFQALINESFKDYEVKWNTNFDNCVFHSGYDGVSARISTRGNYGIIELDKQQPLFEILNAPRCNALSVKFFYPSRSGQVVAYWVLAMRPHVSPTIGYKAVFYLADASYSSSGVQVYFLKDGKMFYEQTVMAGIDQGYNWYMETADPVTYFGVDAEKYDYAWFQVDGTSSVSGVLPGTTYPFYVQKLSFKWV